MTFLIPEDDETQINYMENPWFIWICKKWLNRGDIVQTTPTMT